MISKVPTDINEFAVKITESVNKAIRKMAEKAALNNEELIVGDNNGSFKSIPAKELLKKLPK
ncbi:hypothetical protein HQ865_15700 [Mucilaginibacter mali]|uniref:Uncharacterized protein n=1 Tax=Mucilaginibacter mali TaxID=2740462 RepID=A0A7D4UBS9_9SPHI|nr:hypothetical protein [Mucilaginibacter mali]QKJ31138.1 hypothetical protein HQ865_15700 [Mucilaginibacter mali]